MLMSSPPATWFLESSPPSIYTETPFGVCLMGGARRYIDNMPFLPRVDGKNRSESQAKNRSESQAKNKSESQAKNKSEQDRSSQER